MKIVSVTDCFNILRGTGLINISDETRALVACMETYGRMCPCDPEDARLAQFNKCKSLYISFARRASSFRNQLLAKISDNVIEFSSDGQYISTISRNV